MYNTIKTYISTHPAIASAIHTFAATFIVTFLAALAAIPQDQILSPSTWTTAFVIGLINSAFRAALKKVSPFA